MTIHNESFLQGTYRLAADVVVGVVMDVIVAIVQDGVMVMGMAEGVAEVKPVVAAGQSVVTGLLACLVARWWE